MLEEANYIEIGNLEGGILSIERFKINDTEASILININEISTKGRQDERKLSWLLCKQYFGFRCAYCLKKSSHLTRDHFVPKCMGGGKGKRNIVPSCNRCNQRKDNSHPRNWCDNNQLKRIFNYFSQFGTPKRFHK